jgi:hypothetical protein
MKWKFALYEQQTKETEVFRSESAADLAADSLWQAKRAEKIPALFF